MTSAMKNTLVAQRNMPVISQHKKQLPKFFPVTMAAIWLMTAGSVAADELAVGRFSSEGLGGWEEKSFKGFTEYRLTQENGATVVCATSQAAASGLVKKMTFNPRKFRYLHWSWKIEHTIAGGDETSKSGDDYAARIYVVFAGKYFWQTKALNYIWANRLKKGDSLPNAYSTNAIMVAVQSGTENTGQWLVEVRDVFADYKKLFGADPGEASAIAIMSDTDNTGESGIAWYGDITLSTDP